jgi:HlyD family secretion protein
MHHHSACTDCELHHVSIDSCMESPAVSDRQKRVRSWHRVPALRLDLRFVRSNSVAGLFRVCDPLSQQFVELYELECMVAQSINGERSVSDLVIFARSYNPAITTAQIELLIVQLLEAGLLEEPQPDGHGKVIPFRPPTKPADEFAAFRNEIALDLQRDEAMNWTEAPSAGPRTPLFEAAGPPQRASAPRVPTLPVRPSPVPAPKAFPPPGLDDATNIESVGFFDSDDDEDGAFANTNVVVGTDPFEALEQNRSRMIAAGDPDVIASSPMPAPTPIASPPTVPAPSGLLDAPDPDPEPPRMTTPRQAEAEQEGLFVSTQKARRWYQRRSIKVLAVLVGLLLITAIVQYPLYITSECAIIPSQRAYVRSPMGGVISEILVDEGTFVKKGEIIAKLDDRQLAADRRKAVAELDRINAELDRLHRGARTEEIAQARALASGRASAVAFAKKELDRRLRMVREGVGARAAAEQARGDYAAKQGAYAEAAAALRLLQSGARPEEISALEANHKRAKAELEFIDQKLADMVVIRAPMDGVVLTPKFRERLQESIEAGGLVCEIADMRIVRAEIFVPEREIDSIVPGMPVVVKVESYPRHPFKGKVDFIAPAVETRNKTNVVRVVAVLENSENLLRRDMTGYGEIEAGDRSLFNLATRRLMRWIRVRFLL